VGDAAAAFRLVVMGVAWSLNPSEFGRFLSISSLRGTS